MGRQRAVVLFRIAVVLAAVVFLGLLVQIPSTGAESEAEQADALYDKGLELYEQQDYTGAATCLEQAVAVRHGLGLQKDEADALNSLGRVAQELAQYDEALGYYERALTIYGSSRLEKGQKALAIYDGLGMEREEAATLTSAAAAAGDLGQYHTALDYHQQAVAIYRKLGLEEEEADALNDEGALAADLGQYQTALDYHQQAAAIYRKLGTQKDEADALNNLGKAAEELGQYDEALGYYEQALAIYCNLGLAQETRLTVLNVADVQMSQGRLEEAWELKFAWAILEPRGDPTKSPSVPTGDPLLLGRVDLLQQQPRQAADEFEAAVKKAGETFSYQVASQIGLGLAREALGELEEAKGAYGRAVELLEQERERAATPERGRFFETRDYGFSRMEAYEGLVRVLHRFHQEEEAFYWSEHTKARMLLEALARAPYASPVDLPRDLRKQEDDLTNRFAALSTLLEAEEKPQRRGALEAQLKGAREQLDALVARLCKEYPEYASMKYPEPRHANELAVAAGEVLLAYEVTGPETLVFLVRGGKVERVLEISISRQDLEKLIRDYREGYEQVENEADLGEVDLALSYRLYELLLRQPLGEVKPGEQVVIVPDETIALVPLEGLVASVPEVSWRQGEHGPVAQGVVYVGDRWCFTYWQSGTSLTMVRQRPKSAVGEGVLVVADPVFDAADPRLAGTEFAQAATQPAQGGFALLGSPRDSLGQAYGPQVCARLKHGESLVKRLQALYGDKLKKLVDLDANKKLLRQEALEQYGQVIFYTHGVLDQEVPWLRQPALVLSLVGNAPGEDGYLTMAEVMDLKLRAQVVGLMACQSGAGRVLGGEGVMGMGRAFQYAGADSVVATLWYVESESTVLLTEEFLRALQQGQGEGQALASARQALRQAGYDSPFYWAPFILIGERGVK